MNWTTTRKLLTTFVITLFTSINAFAQQQGTISTTVATQPIQTQLGLHTVPSTNLLANYQSANTTGVVNQPVNNANGLNAGGFRASNLNGFTINLSAGTTLTSNPQALAAFNAAANQWLSKIADPITINIDADLADLGPSNIIGQTNSFLLYGTYDEIRDQLVAKAATKGPSNAVVTHLPTGAQFAAFMPVGIGLSGNVTATKANLKAMGFANLDQDFGASDATMQFNTQFNFDYDPTDGITPGTIDFQTAVTHEIGHVLGFISVVDVVDFALANNLTGTVDPNPLDLFRFSNFGGFNPSTDAEFTTYPRFLATGNTPFTDDLASERLMSTGRTTGDGSQASHWKDDQLTSNFIGIMDPTLSFGVSEPITAADLRALDLIGYSVVPEPSSYIMVLVGLVAMVKLARVSKAKTQGC